MTVKINAIRILVIEDNKERIEIFQKWKPVWANYVLASSPGVALGLIRRDHGLVYAGVMLDHDLQEQTVCESEESYSGTQISIAIVRHFSFEIPVLIHSMNESKASGMAKILTNADFSVTRLPMFQLTEQRFHDWLEEVKENWECIQRH